MRSGIGNDPRDPFFVSNVGGASGSQPAAASQSVTPASDGAPFRVSGQYTSTNTPLAEGERIDLPITLYRRVQASIGLAVNGYSDTMNASQTIFMAADTYGKASGGPLVVANAVYNPASNMLVRSTGDTAGAFTSDSAYYTESTALIAAGATITGGSRASGAVPGGIGSRFNLFSAEVYAGTAGTLSVERSVDGTNWFQCATLAVAAASSGKLDCVLTAGFYRGKFVNGAAAQTSFLLTTGYTS